MRHIIISQAINGKWMELISFPVDEETSYEDVVNDILEIKKIIIDSNTVVTLNSHKEVAIFNLNHGPVNIHYLNTNEYDKRGKVLKFQKED